MNRRGITDKRISYRDSHTISSGTISDEKCCDMANLGPDQKFRHKKWNGQRMNNQLRQQHLLVDAQDVKYLQDIWTFYYLVPDKQAKKGGKWDSFLEKLADVASIQDFGAVMHAIYEPRKLPKGCRYYFFKNVIDEKTRELTPIKPLWEDARNLDGFEIYAEYPIVEHRKGARGKGPRTPPQPVENAEAERRWRDLALAVMTRAKKDGQPIIPVTIHDHINGIEFNVRKNAVKVGLWVDKGVSIPQVEDIKQVLKNFLEYPKLLEHRPIELARVLTE